MINEHELAVLLNDLSEHGLEAGDVGTVVSVHRGGEGYTLVFVNLAGDTVALATVRATQVRAVSRRDITHVRELATA